MQPRWQPLGESSSSNSRFLSPSTPWGLGHKFNKTNPKSSDQTLFGINERQTARTKFSSDLEIQLGWRDFTGFSPRIQQFSSRFRRELLNSRRESSNSRRMFSNSRRRIRRELLILQKITTKREKRKVNLVATENCPILCYEEIYFSLFSVCGDFLEN